MTTSGKSLAELVDELEEWFHRIEERLLKLGVLEKEADCEG